MPKKTFKTIFLILALLLLIFPFLNSLNEFMTAFVLKIGWYRNIEKIFIPYETRMIVLIIRLIGFEAVASPTTVSLLRGGIWHKILISWNCTGWQSLIIFLITLSTGLSGRYSRISKLQVATIGLLGTYIINIIRITLVVISIIFLPQVPAIILHNYLSTLITIFWLFFFWWFSYRYVLDKRVTFKKEEAVKV